MPDANDRWHADGLPDDPFSEADAVGGEAVRWPPLLPLGGAGDGPPAFPIEVLPDWWGQMASALSEATRTPVDIAAMMGLSVVATATAKRARVQIQPGWLESLNLYVLTVAEPGAGKSPVFSAMTAPIRAHETAERQRLAPEVRRARLRREAMQARLEHLRKTAAQAHKAADRDKALSEAERLLGELDEHAVPVVPRLFGMDISAEKVASLLSEQGGRFAVLSAEGDLFGTIAGRYARNGAPNLAIYKQGWSDPIYRVDRISRDAETIAWPTLTLGLATQPSVLAKLGQVTEFRGQGFVARWLFCVPTIVFGARNCRPQPVPPAVRQRYDEAVCRLLALEPDPHQDAPTDCRTLRLAPAALERFWQLRERIEPRMADGGDLAELRDWASKLDAQVVRIAGLLHMAEHVDDEAPWAHPLTAETMARAEKLGDYLVAHAQTAFGVMEGDEALEETLRVWRWIQADGRDVIPHIELWRGVKKRSWTRDDLDDALRPLFDAGYLLRRQQATGGRPRQVYLVRPGQAQTVH